MTNLQSFYGLHNELKKGVDDNLMGIFEYLEQVKPIINTWISNGFLDMAMYISDDTTSGRALELQKTAKQLGALIDNLLEEYLGIDEEEANKLIEGSRNICESLAVIHFLTDKYSDYIDSIQKNTFSVDTIEMTPYVTEVAAQGVSILIEDIRVTLDIIIKFDVYMPEYALSEEELSDIMEYLEDNGRGSYELGVMKKREVGERLNECKTPSL